MNLAQWETAISSPCALVFGPSCVSHWCLRPTEFKKSFVICASIILHITAEAARKGLFSDISMQRWCSNEKMAAEHIRYKTGPLVPHSDPPWNKCAQAISSETLWSAAVFSSQWKYQMDPLAVFISTVLKLFSELNRALLPDGWRTLMPHWNPRLTASMVPDLLV